MSGVLAACGLVPGGGRVLRTRGLADPSGGTFDAADDFDVVLESPDLPILRVIDHPHDETTVDAAAMPGLLSDIDHALLTATGVTRRGLLRLRVMAEMCPADNSVSLRFRGD